MDWISIFFTVFIVVLWFVTFALRHSMTKRAVQLYGLKWDSDFQRKYANIGSLLAIPFYAFCIWFIWTRVGTG